MQSLSYSFLHFLHLVYVWLETTFGTVQKWSLRPLLDSPKGGLNIGILLYSEPYGVTAPSQIWSSGWEFTFHTALIWNNFERLENNNQNNNNNKKKLCWRHCGAVCKGCCIWLKISNSAPHLYTSWTTKLHHAEKVAYRVGDCSHLGPFAATHWNQIFRLFIKQFI